MLYQDYLFLIQRTELIEEYKKIYEEELKRYKEERQKDPNHKLIYHNNYYHL